MPAAAVAPVKPVLRCKVVIVGDATVGKTCLVNAFLHKGPANKDYRMTGSVELSIQSISLPSCTAELAIHDIGGHDVFLTDTTPRHCEGAAAAVVVYDCTNRRSFDSCDKWLRVLKAARAGDRPMPIALVGTKSDLLRERSISGSTVSPAQGTELARAQGMQFFQCSAVAMDSAQAPFQWIAEQFGQSYEEKLDKITLHT